MKLGEKGKVYGLIKPAALKRHSAFAQDDDDDEQNDVNAQLREVSRKRQKQAEAEQLRLMKEDPSVYDYDGVYDKMQSTKDDAPKKQPVKQQSKYIGALMEKAKVREREWGIAYDAKLQRERKNEDDTYAGKEKFVTSSYKKKLQEDQMWKAEEARRAALEEDVTKKSNLNSFYKNLLDRNESYGGIKEEKPQEKKKEEKKEDRRDSKEEKKDRDDDRKDRDDKKDGKDDKDVKKESKDIKKEEQEIKKEETIKKEEAKKEGGEEEEKEKKEEENKEEKKEVRLKAPVQKLGEDAVNAAKLRYLQRKGLA